MRLVAGLVLVACVAGCGGTIGEGSSTSAGTTAGTAAVRLLAAPPIEAVDEPAHPGALELEGRGSTGLELRQCFFATGIGAAATTTEAEPECRHPTAEEAADLRARLREQQEALAVAEGSAPRTIARLRFNGSGRLELAAWRTKSDHLCMEATTWTGLGGGSAGGFGPCLEGADCHPSLCLQEVTTSGRKGIDGYGLVGVVAASADRIDLTMRDGETRSYPLQGPLVAGFPERVFMIHLGARSQRAVAVYDGDMRVAHVEKSADTLAFEECAKQSDPLANNYEPSPKELQAASARFSACMRAHGAPLPPTTG